MQHGEDQMVLVRGLFVHEAVYEELRGRRWCIKWIFFSVSFEWCGFCQALHYKRLHRGVLLLQRR